MIARADVRLALRKLQNPERFFKEGVFKLCKEVYYGDERENQVNATEMECTDYFEDGVTELFKALDAVQSGKVIMNKVSKNDARMLVKWWDDHTLHQHQAVGRPDGYYDVIRR